MPSHRRYKMSIYHKDVCHLIGMTEQECMSWTHTFTPAHKMFISEDGYLGCIYTDGDDGLMLFSTDCECFEDEGVSVQISGNYCNIDFASMHEIHTKLSGWED